MKKKYLVILGVVLILICFIVTIASGRQYTLVIPCIQGEENIENYDISADQNYEIFRVTDKYIRDGNLYITLNSVSKGKAYIDISSGEFSHMDIVYVHRFGIITIGNYFGRANGSFIIPFAVTLYLVIILASVIVRYRKDMKRSIYRYENIRHLGWIVYLISLILGQRVFFISSPVDAIRSVMNSAADFAVVALPFAFVVSVLVSVSNIVLVFREGRNWRNLLGVILGIIICMATISPIIVSDLLQKSTILDVHNECGIAAYVDIGLTNVVLIAVTYLECILIAAIILTVKAARNIPSFNKDFILILGCQIHPDGSLTPLLKGRTDRAMEFAEMQEKATGKKIIFVPSGGKGSDEVIAEGQAIRNYLVENGIPEERIITEDRSENTFQNMKFSLELIKDKINVSEPKLAFSTTSYHVFRSGILAEQQGIHAEGIGSKTKSYFYINAFVREFIATVYSEWKTHIKVVLEMVIFFLMSDLILYLSNIL